MPSKIFSSAILGINARPVEVEADLSAGLPSFTIVGLPDKAIEESRERIRSAIRNSHQNFPTKRITVNLAPANIQKSGPSYDLPIATAILLAAEQIAPEKLKNSTLVGELSLDGILRPVSGILPIAQMAKKLNHPRLYLPIDNAAEASLIDGLEIYPVQSLTEFIKFLNNEKTIQPFKEKLKIDSITSPEIDFADIKGQEHAKRALEIAASGGHNILMQGPPGSGKTLLAKALSGILPSLTQDEMISLTTIYSIAGALSPDQPLINHRPFRSPHHTASHIAIVGGGGYPRPGEISLAHHGVLFLDELPEFPRVVLQTLRQPMEEGEVAISRAATSVRYPARFMLVASMNPCPCGYLTDPDKNCQCHPAQIINYRKKISGPLLDRIDLHLEVPRLSYDKLTAKTNLTTSSEIKKRVEKARAIQRKRLAPYKISLNAEITPRLIEKFCILDDKTNELLKSAVDRLQLSGRAYHRILKIARTIADLADCDNIQTTHLAEALQYRPQELAIF